MGKIEGGIPYGGKVRRYVGRVMRTLKPKLIVLYGSAATQSFGVGSDLDLLVISDHLPKNFLQRMKILYELNTENAPMDIVGYTTKEFEEMILKLHPTALSVLTEGIPMYGEKYYGEARAFLSQMNVKIVKNDCGWEIAKK